MDRRHYPRIPFQAPAFIVKNEQPIFSQVQNISRSGIFVRTRCAYELDETVMVSLYFFNGSVTLSVTLPCKVARMENNGAGFTAQGIDLEEFLFIHNLTHARSGNPAR